jgi:hypothetical protein
MAKRQVIPLVALVWIAAFLLPTSGIISLEHVRSDRYIYAVLPGLLLLLVHAIESWTGAKAQYAKVAVYVYLAGSLLVRAPIWRSDSALWAHEVAMEDSCSEGWAYLGQVSLAQGDFQRRRGSTREGISRGASNHFVQASRGYSA